jgi:alcohol oxidase
MILTEHLLDHHAGTIPFLASEDADSLDVIFREDETKLERMANFAENGYI